MGKSRPHNKKASKSRAKSVLGAGGSVSKQKMNEDPSKLLEQATIQLQTGQPDAALQLAQQALNSAPDNSPSQLVALNTVGEIYVELGEIDVAKQHFMRAIELDPNGTIPEAEGGGAEKFLWLAQLSEQGGKDSVQWFEKGVSWEEDAENRCESLITEALLVAPNAPEVLQTLASIRISQLRTEEAQAALRRSLDLWKDLPPEDLSIPDFATRISLSRLLMEVSMELEALEVLERLILEDDQSVEAWYLGGWCLQLLAGKQQAPKDADEEDGNTPEARRHASLVASREWLKQSLTLYDLVQYEDERLKEHALELVQEMNKEIGEDMNDDEAGEGEEDWEDEEIEQTAPDKVGSDRFPRAITRAKFIPAVRLRVANSSMMDLVSAPSGEDSSLKDPVVQVEAVDIASAVSKAGTATENTAAAKEEVTQSEYETDSDGSGDEWETQSLYEDAIQVLRDDQLREGVPDACTLEEAVAYRKRLHEVGKAAFVEETLGQDKVTARKLCTAFGILPPAFLDDAPDEAFHPLLAIAISREFSRRPKLPQYNTIDDAVKLLKESKNIVVLTGAGISTSLGIPDFRSKDTGLYSQLAHLGLSDPQEVFDIQVFREDPSIFFSIAKDILPTEKKFSPTHAFIRVLQDKGKLLTNYTQNIDNIEANAGVLPENIVQCHGSFATATCVKCQYKVKGDEIFDEIKQGVIPQCDACRKRIAEDSGIKRKRSSNGVHKNRKDNDGDSTDDDYEIPTPGVMKPDITFFGEDLPDEFGRRLLHHDRDQVDLVIVIGTSLKVAPVAEVPGVLPRTVPQLYISRTVSHLFLISACVAYGIRYRSTGRLRRGVQPTMEYLIRFAQAHESFRQAEIQALADLAGVKLEFIHYDKNSPFCTIRLPDEAAARAVITRSIIAKDIFELWGQGTNFDEVYADVRRRTEDRWAQYRDSSFRFTIDSFAGKRSSEKKREIIQSFSFLGFKGPIRMKNPDQDFWVFEDYGLDLNSPGTPRPEGQEPKIIYFGRWIANSSRDVVNKYDLKKRRYISTTSMDAELTLITANMAHAAPGKLFYDPFVGTGSFLVAMSHFGAETFGSDIDGRSFRGKEMMERGGTMGVLSNFQQYDMVGKFMDVFTSDLTNTPLRSAQFLDGIICDPPYGIREGLRVLGRREGLRNEEVIIDGVPAHYRPGYIAPKKPYGFEAMLNDILNFAVRSLVTNGRLAMWMPTANDEEVELAVPMHPNLEVVNVSVQPFYTWSRRLITYRRLPEGQVSDVSKGRQKLDAQGIHIYTLQVPSKLSLFHSKSPKLPFQIHPLFPLNPLYFPRQLFPQQPSQTLPFLIIQILPLPTPKHHIAQMSLSLPFRRPIRRPGDNMEVNMRDLLRSSDT
ncbi:SIR2-domain-containing protein [Aspergillus costaricaensis CBS 115574]|uniref:SIR2-domain-containing protein n=1 Tax=Aspergillus costaricaensis CBS 115574 TaxID=1448317 RepID=A0ACD1IN80_9EURO|nr:SIR2-domain-containing protein [Aspergillus costaricaensis CBS 115574]RAK91501.1 SIR2-domain-containing protein [Aspergillus costaricaensis CBS 115574]